MDEMRHSRDILILPKRLSISIFNKEYSHLLSTGKCNYQPDSFKIFKSSLNIKKIFILHFLVA